MNKPRQFQIIQSPSNPISAHLTCTICREVFYNPLRVDCGHTFCSGCINQWIQVKRTCPECRYTITTNFVSEKDLLAESLIEDIEVECLRCSTWRGTLKEFKEHRKNSCLVSLILQEEPENLIEIEDDFQHDQVIDIDSILEIETDKQSEDNDSVIMEQKVDGYIYNLIYK